VRAYADLDLGKAKDALAESEDILKKAPDNLEAQIIRERARMLGSDKERAAAAEALEKLARKAKSKIGRHALGVTYLAVGDVKNAQPQLEQALDAVTDESPNPVAYRTHTALARVLVGAGNLQDAYKHVLEAIKANAAYYPALELQAMIFVRNGEADKALDLIADLDNRLKTDNDAKGSPLLALARGEATCAKKNATQADKDAGEKILVDLKDKIQPPSDLGRAAAACDPKLPEKLGVPAPAADGSAPKQPPPHRRHR